MKKAIIILCSICILACVGMLTSNVTQLIKQANTLPADQVNANVNVMLKRPSGWKKLYEQAPIKDINFDILDGSTATIPITAELYRQFYDYDDEAVIQKVYHSTTHDAYLNLIHKQAGGYAGSIPVGLIFVTEPSAEELQIAKEANVSMDVTPIAKDGFVFITHKSNPVNSLTVEQVQKIYTGEITNWNQVGGKDQAIKAYQREPNSGSQTAMEQLVMKDKPMTPPIKTMIKTGMGMLIDSVAEYKNESAAIGYTYYYYINNLYKNDNIKVLQINGITPGNKNLLSGAYPFTTNYYAVIRKDEPTGSDARRLRDWLLTEDGQKLVELAGYCRRK